MLAVFLQQGGAASHPPWTPARYAGVAEENGLEARILCPSATRVELEAMPREKFFIMVFEISRRR